MSQRKHPIESSTTRKRCTREKHTRLRKCIPVNLSGPGFTTHTLMTHKRRISVQMEHAEVTISVTETSAPCRHTSSATLTGGSKPPDVCAECGARWLLNFHDAVRTLGLTGTQLKSAANEGRLHLFCSPQNEIWICERSIQQMKENS